MRTVPKLAALLIGISLATAAAATTTPSTNWTAVEPISSECAFPSIGTNDDYWSSAETDIACFDFDAIPAFERETHIMVEPEEGGGPTVKG